METSNKKLAKRRRSASQLAVVWRRFRRNKAAIAGLVLVGFIVFRFLFRTLPSEEFSMSVQRLHLSTTLSRLVSPTWYRAFRDRCLQRNTPER